MTNAIQTYAFLRAQCKLRPIDACTDAAQQHGLTVQALAAALLAQGIDTATSLTLI